MENTKVTKNLRVNDVLAKECLKKQLKSKLQIHFELHRKVLKELENIFSHKIIRFLGVDFVYIKSENIMIPDLEKQPYISFHDVSDYDEENFGKEYLFLDGYQSSLPTLKEIRKMEVTYLNRSKEQELENSAILCICDDARLRYSNYFDLPCCYDVLGKKLVTYDEVKENYKIISFPVIRLSNEISCAEDFISKVIIKMSLLPLGLSDELRETLEDMFVLMNGEKAYEEYRRDENSGAYELEIFEERLLDDIVNGKGNMDLYKSMQRSLIGILNEYAEKKTIEGVMVQSKEDLLNCEYNRAAIEPYEERLLTDPNRGHWDLWLDDDTEDFTVQMEDYFMARNPKCDINENGVIAIDFGTKSTIVVYQSDIEHSLPMGIGDGELSREPCAKRYENPTIMQFVNLDRFMECYREKKGRPDTRWEDLPISHTAMDKFQNSESEHYYAFLYQIKQWAGLREKQFRIQPIEGNSFVLPSFLDIGEDDVNPIEIYAYYIGLYINNMRKGHGIFLDYYLSFPVTYEIRIREKIIESFRKGLKKSLPEPIQNDPEIMSRFSVSGDISEPAAYAVCALQEYGFDPDEDDEIFYGIFDFGGGTTDFDFGLWKKSKKRRYDYRIESFGAGGDEFLGGENLLEMLAFDIFKENQDIMRQNGYTFTLAPKCTEFLGSDALLADSQEAEKNMHNMMEKLRPFWEKEELETNSKEQMIINILENKILQYNKSAYAAEIKDGMAELIRQVNSGAYNLEVEYDDILREAQKYIEQYDKIRYSKVDDVVALKVFLFDKDGNAHPNVELKTTQSHIEDFIENKIREGVKNFFVALMLSYQNEKVKKPSTVNILLAGNSCKSPVVRKVFEEEIKLHEEKIKAMYDSKEVGKLFDIFPPLGTSEAYKKMKERGLDYKENDFERPTGKTGVAFGLIQCRRGGTIERVTEVSTNREIPFQFFLGWQSRKKFVLFKDESKMTSLLGKPDYNNWYKFIEADEDTFYIYYTSLPECVKGNLLVEGNSAVRRVKCTIDVVNEDAFVYIKAVTPHSIQYVVSTSYDVEKDKIGEIFEKELT